MPFVNAKCPNCGGALQVDNAKRAAMCPFCKEAFVVEDAINNYVTNYNTIIEHLHAANVNLNVNPAFEIRAGELIKYNGAETEVIIPPSVKVIGGVFYERENRYIGAFQGCTELKRVIIPESVTEIRGKDCNYHHGGAFKDCSSLETVQFPNTLRIIGDSAFSYCTALEGISFPSSLRSIGDHAFFGCESLESLTFPDNVSVGHQAFGCCSNLRSVYIPANVTIGMSAFSGGCGKLQTVHFEGGIRNINAFEESPWFNAQWRKQVEEQAKRTQEEKEKKDALILARMRANQCLYCGGDFSLFSRTCKKCGKKKTY